MEIRLKRAYEAPLKSDGARILVDRLWPRGLSKEKAELHEWMRAIAPSSELRKWFNHDPRRWKEFVESYRRELKGHADLVARLLDLTKKERLTLVYGARDREHNNAAVLKEYLQEIGS